MSSFQDVFVFVSAVVSAVKSQVTAFGDYSNAVVVLAIEELVLTLSAFLLFLFTEQGHNVTDPTSRNIYIIAFVNALVIELWDVHVTSRTVRRYAHHGDDRKEAKRKEATRYFILSLLVGMVLYLPFPIVAFARSGWEFRYFQPGNLESSQTLKNLLLSAFVLGLARMVIFPWRLFLPNNVLKGVTLPEIPIMDPILRIVVAVLWAMSVFYASEGPESGSLNFLFVLVALQEMEFLAEWFRSLAWASWDAEAEEDERMADNTSITRSSSFEAIESRKKENLSYTEQQQPLRYSAGDTTSETEAEA